MLTLLHSVHAIFFFIVGIYTLAIYNLLSILLLFGVRQMFYQKNFIKGMAPAFINIVVYSVMCTLTIGYDNNFMLYLFLIALGSIFVTFNCDEFRHLKSYQYIMPSSMCLIFISTTIIASYITPVFSPDLFKYKMLFQIANILWVCGIIEIFALMFSVETRRIKRDISVAIAENIRTTVCETPVTCENTNIPVSITLGVAEYIPGFDVDKIIKKADDNLYYGKTHGKNVVISSIKKP